MWPSQAMSKKAEDMGFNLDLKKKSSKQQISSKKAKERGILPQSNRSSKDSDMLKSKYGIGPSFSDPVHKRRQSADVKTFVRATLNNSQETVKGSATEADELVKHMSNLPDYLRRPDRGENIQEKALNFGVLDWTRLEKWKHRQKHIPALASKFTSFNNSESSSRTAMKSSTNAASNYKFAEQQHLLSSSVKAYYKDGLPHDTEPPFQNVKRFQDSETETKSSRYEQRMKSWTSKSSGKSRSDVPIEKEKRRDLNKVSSQVGNLRYHGVSIVPNENTNGRDDESEKNMDRSHEFNLKQKDRNHKSTLDMGLPSKDKGVSHGSKKSLSSRSNKSKKKEEQFPEYDIDVGNKQCHGKPSNIVLLRPRQIPQTGSPDDIRPSHLRMSLDENLEESSQSRLSNDSLPEEVFSEDFCSEIPHSCPLPTMVAPAAAADTMQHRTNTDWSRDHSSVVSQTPACSEEMSTLHSEGPYTEKDASDVKLTNQYIFGKLKEPLDHETAELTIKRDSNPSPNRRFSFSISRIGRSFSFKEGSTLPQFSSNYVSAQSGPVTSASARLDNPSKGKANGHNRTRSSPLRRLLDPLLKNKTAADIHHRAESSQTPKGILDSISYRTTSFGESLQIEKGKGSMIQAVLQLTIKNGLPLFKFVLNNNDKSILAAAMKNLALPGKDDSGCNFTFYLVNEIKKKSGGWISQGNKERNCGYVYDVVGQMKASSSKITEPSGLNSNKQCMVKEYVLVGVEISQTEKGPPKFNQSNELGAVVVDIPCESLSHKELYSDKNLLSSGCLKCLADERCTCSSGETEVPGSTTVILPGGIHSSPDNGEPSPLIYRWKSGGSCDCGGWDIGCQLLVLTNQKRISKSFPGLFQLFDQEGAEQKSPFFTLVPLKDGFYSVEFNSSITRLQAFFISVTVLSSQKLPGTIELSKMHEGIGKEPSIKSNGGFQGKASIRYTPIPPLSPVGRV
ncbi:hypothetical protein L6164_003447 [Bauhinia variegata]|uniref:Uncharacterized protein n=1 Tax=Bauhinia variegata TaxID=167791 RepID=A0ACB9Q0R9_BAUVA|nr:hypothetical protein L6164_003447 [Bauhinia variegata]